MTNSLLESAPFRSLRVFAAFVLCALAGVTGCGDEETVTVESFDRTCAVNPAHVCCSEPMKGTPCCSVETYQDPQCYFTLLCVTEPTHRCCAAGADTDPCCTVEGSYTEACIMANAAAP